jgi:hypothetical protein
VAEWSCSGLQSRVRRFNSDPGLQFVIHPRKTRYGGFFVVCDMRWLAQGRLPRWPDVVIQVLRIVECVLLLLFC